jgi:hypothetical protein
VSGESKGEGSWFQARDMSGWEFVTMSKASVFQVSGFLLYITKGYDPDMLIICKAV